MVFFYFMWNFGGHRFVAKIYIFIPKFSQSSHFIAKSAYVAGGSVSLGIIP